MAYIGMILFFLVGPALGLLGLVKPSRFHRGGWKPGRLKLLGIGLAVSIGGLVLFGVNSDELRPKEPSSASSTTAEDTTPPPTKAPEVATSPTQVTTPAATMSPGTEPTAAAKFGDAAPLPAKTAQAATLAKPAIKVPEGAVAKYCANEAKKVVILRQSEQRFPPLPASAGTDAVLEQARKASAWEEQQLAPLTEELVAEIGLDRNKIVYLATKHQWSLKCRALEAGKPLLDVAEALAATDDDWRTVEHAFKQRLYQVYQGASRPGCAAGSRRSVHRGGKRAIDRDLHRDRERQAQRPP